RALRTVAGRTARGAGGGRQLRAAGHPRDAGADRVPPDRQGPRAGVGRAVDLGLGRGVGRRRAPRRGTDRPVRKLTAVLVTGCSSGIGRATAERLARIGRGRGWSVYATARRLDAIDDLAAAGCRLLQLDVTDDASMTAAVKAVEDESGAVDVLVNNAGYGEYGAVEEVALDAVRRQFETNVFGLARMAQLVLPAMRAKRSGRIVNVSSMG